MKRFGYVLQKGEHKTEMKGEEGDIGLLVVLVPNCTEVECLFSTTDCIVSVESVDGLELIAVQHTACRSLPKISLGVPLVLSHHFIGSCVWHFRSLAVRRWSVIVIARNLTD